MFQQVFLLCVLQITLYIVYMTNENFDLKTFSGRLAYAMKIANNSNQTSFAKSIDVTPQTIQYLVTKGKGSTHASKIAEKLGVNVDWLVYGQGSMFDETNKIQLVREEEQPYKSYKDFDFVVVQAYQASQKSLNTQNSYITTKSGFPCPVEIIEGTGSDPQNLRVLFMNNDSMTPTFNKNTLLLVDISDFEMQSGLVYLVNWYGEERIKRVFKDGKNSFKLKSDNQHNALYADDWVDFNNNDDVKVLGRIVWQAGNL